MKRYDARIGGPMDLRLGIMGWELDVGKNAFVGFPNGQVPLTRDRFRVGSGRSIYEEISNPEYEGVRTELLAALVGLSLGSKVEEEWRFDSDGRALEVVITVGGDDERAKKGLGISITAKINSRVLRFIRDITNYFGNGYERSGYIDSELLPLHMTLAKILGDDEKEWLKFFY